MKDQLKQFCLLARVRIRAKRILIFSPSPPTSALLEKWQLVNRKRFVFPSLQRQNLLLLRNKRSDGHLSGHVNAHHARIWKLENPHEVLESLRDTPKSNVFCAISRRKVYGPFVFGEPTVTDSAFLNALQVWLFSELKEREPNNFLWQQDIHRCDAFRST
ncbi:uncharacterized protein TNCV_4701241 [Trichonephila clavipes]|nr:uncharacterized protein TNCV_4701241 [Trichonephila clavipes]